MHQGSFIVQVDGIKLLVVTLIVPSELLVT